MSRHFGSRKDDGETAVLSYYNTTLMKNDIQDLKNDWLRDNAIQFWQEYLEQEFLSEFKNSKIVLLRPSMVELLKPYSVVNAENLRQVLPNFSETTHIFLPISDNSNPERAEASSHWSLLLVSKVDGVAFHYDSMLGMNEQHAYKVMRRLADVLEVPLKFIQLNDTPQQDNGSDCGVYVCLFMKHLLLKRLLMVRTNEKVSMSMGGKRIDAREGRKEMLRIIEDRRKEGIRRSSSKSPAPGGRHSTDLKSPPRIDSPLGSER